MIPANELRIGNWVSIGEMCYAPLTKIDPGVSSGFEGIELTPEILINVGFKWNEEYNILAFEDTAICCYWDGVEYVFKYGLDSELSIAACEYFHELQNLIFCLIKIELTFSPIKTPKCQ